MLTLIVILLAFQMVRLKGEPHTIFFRIVASYAAFHVYTHRGLRDVGLFNESAAHAPGQPNGDGNKQRGKARHEIANEDGCRIHGLLHGGQLFVSASSSRGLLSQVM